MKRRDFLGAGVAALVARAADTVVELRPEEAGATISPHLYGHFIEHLGGVIYDGVWVGRDSVVANIDGIRKQFVDHMKRIGAPNIRWPGGCFADGYHWRDGIGPPARRSRTYNYWHPRMPKGSHDTETNQFGTHEFLRLCELVGAEPYLAANVGTGSPREWYDWVLYCNAPEGTVSQAAQRAANGHSRPYEVRFWGVGNESWGCGGLFKPQDYANEYRRFVSQLPRFGEMFLIAAGPSGGDEKWTRGFFETMPPAVFQRSSRATLHGFALHYYTSFRDTRNQATGFNERQWYDVLDAGRLIESLIETHWKIMGEYDPNHAVKLVVDEWGTWYPGGSEVKPEYILSQTMTLRDALHTGITLDVFNRQAGKLAMCNVAQTINCLHSLFRAEGDRFVRTPAYHVFEMYMPHKGGRVVPAKMAGIAGSASVKERTVTLTLVNPSLADALEVKIRVTGGVKQARGRVLTHEDMRATNTFAAPDEVTPKPLYVALSGGDAAVRMPARSVAAIEMLV